VINVLKEFGAEGSNSLKGVLTKFNGGFHFLETFKGMTLDDVKKTGSA
jgi:hypothetical protein